MNWNLHHNNGYSNGGVETEHHIANGHKKKAFFSSPTRDEALSTKDETSSNNDDIDYRPLLFSGDNTNGTEELPIITASTHPSPQRVDPKGNKNREMALHGAFSTPSISRKLKRPLAQPFIKPVRPDNRISDSQSSPSALKHSASTPSFPLSPSPSKRNRSLGVTFDSEANLDELGSFKTAPTMFMCDHSPITPFFTNAYCFSNHYPCENLIIDGKRYVCTEQYYMFYKARVFGDRRAMREIMHTNDAKLMKKIGAQVAGFNQEKWYKIAIQVMVIASLRKYEQHPELRQQLFKTSGSDLVEANPTDQRWGIGLGMNDWRIRERRMWKGLNWLGRLLTMLRDKLLERPEFLSERDQLLHEMNESFESAESVGCLQQGGARKSRSTM